MWRQIIHWITSSIYENSKLKPGENMLCTEIVLTLRTILVHNMFCKKKSFWQRFTCTKTLWKFFISSRSHLFCYEKSWNGKSDPFANLYFVCHLICILFCHLGNANSFKTALRTCNVGGTSCSTSYKSVNWFLLNLLPQIAKQNHICK